MLPHFHRNLFNSIKRQMAHIEIPSRTLKFTSCCSSPRQPSNPKTPSPAMAGKYKILEDSSAQIIENTAEELPEEDLDIPDEFDGINLAHGVTGVYDIEDLVSLLERENSKDTYVASVPRSFNYVDYICITSGRSKRHMIALAEFVRRVYKKKRYERDYIPCIEGKESNDWMALDLGNIALHIFSEKSRQKYDLETLWAVGPEFDDHLHKKEDHITDILENYSTYLKDLKPMQ